MCISYCSVSYHNHSLQTNNKVVPPKNNIKIKHTHKNNNIKPTNKQNNTHKSTLEHSQTHTKGSIYSQ